MHVTAGRRSVAAATLAASAAVASMGLAPAAHAAKPAPVQVSVVVSVSADGTVATVETEVNRSLQQTKNLTCYLTADSTGAGQVVDCGTAVAASKSGPTTYRTTFANLPPDLYGFLAVIESNADEGTGEGPSGFGFFTILPGG